MSMATFYLVDVPTTLHSFQSKLSHFTDFCLAHAPRFIQRFTASDLILFIALAASTSYLPILLYMRAKRCDRGSRVEIQAHVQDGIATEETPANNINQGDSLIYAKHDASAFGDFWWFNEEQQRMESLLASPSFSGTTYYPTSLVSKKDYDLFAVEPDVSGWNKVPHNTPVKPRPQSVCAFRDDFCPETNESSLADTSFSPPLTEDQSSMLDDTLLNITEDVEGRTTCNEEECDVFTASSGRAHRENMLVGLGISGFDGLGFVPNLNKGRSSRRRSDNEPSAQFLSEIGASYTSTPLRRTRRNITMSTTLSEAN